MTKDDMKLSWSAGKGFQLIGDDYLNLDPNDEADLPWEVFFLMNVFFILADRSAHGEQMRNAITGYAEALNHAAASGVLVEKGRGGKNVQ